MVAQPAAIAVMAGAKPSSTASRQPPTAPLRSPVSPGIRPVTFMEQAMAEAAEWERFTSCPRTEVVAGVSRCSTAFAPSRDARTAPTPTGSCKPRTETSTPRPKRAALTRLALCSDLAPNRAAGAQTAPIPGTVGARPSFTTSQATRRTATTLLALRRSIAPEISMARPFMAVAGIATLTWGAAQSGS